MAEDIRSYNVGSSDYAKHKIQPWDIWLEYNLNPWEADIVKRILRRKEGQSRREDLEKIIHVAKELIRQIDEKEAENNHSMNQLTKEQAIAFAESKVYESWTPRQIVDFQLFQDRLCIPLDVFHRAMEKVLNRPVYTHEFINMERLVEEYKGEKPAPTLEEIMELIPEEKRMIIFA